MAAASDPFESYLTRASTLFEAGDIVQAGQIWQAILKKKPDHQIARAGLYKVKLYFDARATQDGLVSQKATGETGNAPAPESQDPEVLRLLEQGCVLYDAGHAEDALAKWIQVLAKEPENVLAKGYINGARRTLGQPEAAPGPAPVSAGAPSPVPGPGLDTERLLRDGCTLFDMGQLEDALRKWEQILAHDPGHVLARAYVQDARKELGLPPPEELAQPVFAVPEPVVAEAVQAEDEHLDRLIRDGVQLYDMGMTREAAQKWQQVLDLAPGHLDAEAYLIMARRDLESPPPPAARPVPAAPSPELSARDLPGLPSWMSQDESYPRVALAPAFEDPSAPAEPGPSTPVSPPPALISGPQKGRKGLNLPEILQGIALPGWMASPAFILGTIAGLVILVLGAFYFLQHRKDQALKQAVAEFRANAVSPVARGATIVSLAQTPEEMQKEAQSALGDDPLLAYFRAKELLRLNPGDAAAGQLLGQAKAALAKEHEPSASLGSFEKQFHDGDLEAADRVMRALLGQNPDDQLLRERASRLYGAMIQAYASKEQWTEAEADLRRSRAMFPEDKSWSAKLLLLTRIQSLPRKERAPWIQLLG